MINKQTFIVNYFIEPFKKYAVFSGRARRKEYWYFILFYYSLNFVYEYISWFPEFPDAIEALPLDLFDLFFFLPVLAVAFRRIHDVDRSALYLLIPFYNLYLLCSEGTKGLNTYGPDPIAR